MKAASDANDLLSEFEAGRLNPGRFHHRDHLQVSYELLERHPFPEALLHLARGLRRLAASAGHPEAYHETMTAAFLALIAERRASSVHDGWEDFATRNPDLLRKQLLEDWYEPETLRSGIARETFVLPRRRCGA